MVDQFDWKAPDLHVIRSYGDVAIYASEHGDIVLRQVDHMGKADAVVIVPRQQASWLIAAIEDALRQSAEADTLPGKSDASS